jgi:glycosyltransferase involved in cell wall biosynthesis
VAGIRVNAQAISSGGNGRLTRILRRRQWTLLAASNPPHKDIPTLVINGSKVCVVLPAFNAARTLAQTLEGLDRALIDEVIVVDDASTDETPEITRRLGVRYAFHGRNHGYGGNQKTCYALALDTGCDIVIMLHPDYQYEPRLVPAMAHMVASGVYDVVVASRILGKGAISGGMPLYKYVSNRFLTFVQNLLIGQKLSEYHSGYRAFSRKVLETLPLLANSDDFLFDNQMLVQCHWWGFRIAEISCPTKYFPEASSINFTRSLKYGFGTLAVSARCFLSRMGLPPPPYLDRAKGPASTLSVGAIRNRISETNIAV